MKNSIKLTALFLLASTGLFAETPSKSTPPANAQITFSSLHSLRGVEIKVENNVASKATVIVYDADGNAIFKDTMPAMKAMKKGYILNQLQNGDYTIEVIDSKQVA